MNKYQGSANGIMEEAPVYTADGEQLGKVKEISGQFFKVDAPMESDYWLSIDMVRIDTTGGIELTYNKDRLDEFKLSSPGEAAALTSRGTGTPYNDNDVTYPSEAYAARVDSTGAPLPGVSLTSDRTDFNGQELRR